MLRTLLSRQEETRRLTGHMPCGERGRLEERDLHVQWSWDWERCQGHRKLGERGPGKYRGARKVPLFVHRGFMFSWLLTQPLVKTPALCLPAHQAQVADNNPKRSFPKVPTPPPKPGLNLLSSILNGLQAQLDPGAIQNTWLMFLHYLGLSWVTKIQ